MAAPTVPSPTLKDLGGNRLLALLARTEQEKLLPLLRREVWRHGQTLYEAGGPIPSIYFPLRAVASELSTMEDGTTVEVATIGNEGMLGLSVLLGGGLYRFRSLRKFQDRS